jgi:hypothetical protein
MATRPPETLGDDFPEPSGPHSVAPTVAPADAQSGPTLSNRAQWTPRHKWPEGLPNRANIAKGLGFL